MVTVGGGDMSAALFIGLGKISVVPSRVSDGSPLDEVI